MSATGRDEHEEWPQDPYAIEREIRIDPADQRPGTILLRHPTAPFIRQASIDDEDVVQRAAYDYLVAVSRMADLPLPEWWLSALDPANDTHPAFGWLPIVDPNTGRPERQIGSVRVENGINRANRSLVLLAGERGNGYALGSEFGLRVVIHELPAPDGGPWIRITGLSASLPFGVYRHSGERSLFDTPIDKLRDLRVLLRRTRDEITEALALDKTSASYRAIRAAPVAGDSWHLELRGRGLSTGDGPPDPFEFFAEFTTDADFQDTSDLHTRKVLLNACGLAPDARVFRCDPASRAGPDLWRMRRPTRQYLDLDNELELELERVPLREPGHFDVVQTWYVRGDDPAAGVKSVPLPDPAPPIRSNDFTAVSAFRNMREIFARFVLYGMPVNNYFQHAALPLRVHYRSGVRPGPGKDGQTVNGSVQPEGWLLNLALIRAPGVQRPRLNVHLALGDLKVRARRRRNGNTPSPAEPLGFAADPRWLWHEAAHVLLMATLGELEFRFAHSMGDGLAAIVADPSSRLARNPRWRGWTFPWVFAPRRHDRCVLHGWGWAGELGRAARDIPDADRLRRKGYITEQILSTSLFRMYRCLGGETVTAAAQDPDEGMRRQASDYAVYLIMDALLMLSNPLVVPANGEAFATALINADEATQTISVGAPATQRVGGCAHRAIRWAFEAQGMFAAPGDENAPGRPPDVDVFIRDQRPLEERFSDGAVVLHDAGSYVPVSLDWADLTDGADIAGVLAPNLPAWFAHTDDMELAGGGLTVTVGNRGGLPARGVIVRLWSRAWPVNQQPPAWDQPAWMLLDTSAPQDIPAGEVRAFAGLALPPAPGRHLLLAEAGCAADRANIDPATGLASSFRVVPLNGLVPLDNNLGLRVI